MYPLIAATLYKQLQPSAGLPTTNLLVTKLFPCFAKHSEIKPALRNNPIPQKPNPVLFSLLGNLYALYHLQEVWQLKNWKNLKWDKFILCNFYITPLCNICWVYHSFAQHSTIQSICIKQVWFFNSDVLNLFTRGMRLMVWANRTQNSWCREKWTHLLHLAKLLPLYYFLHFLLSVPGPKAEEILYHALLCHLEEKTEEIQGLLC